MRLDKAPVVLCSVAGLLLALLLVPRRIAVPVSLLVAGLVTFAVIGAAGLSVIDRYMLVPALMVVLLCAFALTGWTMLEAGAAGPRRERARRFCASRACMRDCSAGHFRSPTISSCRRRAGSWGAGLGV